MNEDRAEEYFYRFVCMNTEQLSELERICSGVSIESQWNERKEGYVVCIPLFDERTCQGIQTFLDGKSDENFTHGVYISLVVDDDQAGFSVPNFILDLLRSSKGTLDVSFTVI